MAIDSARSMKKILRFLFGLLINVCILFVLVKGFSYSFDFAYQVFSTTAVEPGSNKKTAITITDDEPLLDIADSLKKSGVIDNKYAFILKVRINGDAGKMKPGTYTMSPSNTNQEIIDIITGVSGDGTASSGSSDSSSTGDESGGDGQSAVTNANGTGDEGAAEDRTTEAATDGSGDAGDGASGDGSDGGSSDGNSDGDSDAAYTDGE